MLKNIIPSATATEKTITTTTPASGDHKQHEVKSQQGVATNAKLSAMTYASKPRMKTSRPE